MCEWGIPFHVIERNWTDRQLIAFIKARNDRVKEENKRVEEANAKAKRGGKVRR